MRSRAWRSLRLAARIDSPEEARVWLARPDAHIRCDGCVTFDEDAETVLVGDPDRECGCGAFVRDDDGALVWAESEQFSYPRVYLAD